MRFRKRFEIFDETFGIRIEDNAVQVKNESSEAVGQAVHEATISFRTGFQQYTI